MATKHYNIFKYFFNHSFKETCDFFNLTEGQLKSVMSYAYKLPELKFLRKDKRKNHKKFWTYQEILKMLNRCGIKSRQEIAEELDRGNERVIKEKLNHIGLCSSRNINGLNLSLFKKLFNCTPKKIVTTSAGPTSRNKETCFKIILWIDLYEMIEKKEIDCPDILKKIFESYALWQKWRFDFEQIKY